MWGLNKSVCFCLQAGSEIQWKHVHAYLCTHARTHRQKHMHTHTPGVIYQPETCTHTQSCLAVQMAKKMSAFMMHKLFFSRIFLCLTDFLLPLFFLQCLSVFLCSNTPVCLCSFTQHLSLNKAMSLFTHSAVLSLWVICVGRKSCIIRTCWEAVIYTWLLSIRLNSPFMPLIKEHRSRSRDEIYQTKAWWLLII